MNTNVEAKNVQKTETQKVVVIEDDSSIRRSIMIMLQTAGYKATCAEDGAAGLALVRKEMPDLVICDVAMPVMDGYTFIERLRASTDDIATIPVIFLTVRATEEDIARGKALGASAYLAKPIWPSDLLKAVKEHLLMSRW